MHMSTPKNRDLTTLEYIVLGLIGLRPQSGYSILSQFDTALSSWSASPGSIYPMLKRLEKNGVIEGEIEMTYETRPRKVYQLTASGTALLDDWLRLTPEVQPVFQAREIALWRFLFLEQRFSRAEVITWLTAYREQVTAVAEALATSADQEAAQSLHQRLAGQAVAMELAALQHWLDAALAALRAAEA